MTIIVDENFHYRRAITTFEQDIMMLINIDITIFAINYHNSC